MSRIRGRQSRIKFRSRWKASQMKKLRKKFARARVFPPPSSLPIKKADPPRKAIASVSSLPIEELDWEYQCLFTLPPEINSLTTEFLYEKFLNDIKRPKTITQKYIQAVKAMSLEGNPKWLAVDLEFVGAQIHFDSIPLQLFEIARSSMPSVKRSGTAKEMVPLDCTIFNGKVSRKYLLRPLLAVTYPIIGPHYHDKLATDTYWKQQKEHRISENDLHCRTIQAHNEQMAIPRVRRFVKFMERNCPSLCKLNGTNTQPEFLVSTHHPGHVKDFLRKDLEKVLVLFNGTQDCPMLGLHQLGLLIYDIAWRLESAAMFSLKLSTPVVIEEEKLLGVVSAEFPSFSLTTLANTICPEYVKHLLDQGLSPHDSHYDAKVTLKVAEIVYQFRQMNLSVFQKLEEIMKKGSSQLPQEDVWASTRFYAVEQQQLARRYAQFSTKYDGFPLDHWKLLPTAWQNEIAADWKRFLENTP